MMPILREVDHLLVGWLGCRVVAIVGVVCGLPLLIYSLAKVLFAKLLNSATLHRFETLKSFEEHSELQFTVSLITVSTLPMIIFALPVMFMTVYGVYQGYQNFNKLKMTSTNLIYTTHTLIYTINTKRWPIQV